MHVTILKAGPMEQVLKWGLKGTSKREALMGGGGGGESGGMPPQKNLNVSRLKGAENA